MNELSKKRVNFADQIRKVQRQQKMKQMRDNIAKLIETSIHLATQKQLARKQKQIYNKQRFLQVFTEEELNIMQINWTLFQNQQQQYNSIDRQWHYYKIRSAIWYRYKQNKQYKQLQRSIQMFKFQQSLYQDQFFQQMATNYFKQIYPFKKIQFDIKYQGIHKGSILKIYQSEQNQKPLIFYTKQHLNGCVDSLNLIRPTLKLDPIQMLLYRFLQKIDLGCQSHFFGKDLRYFYISTRDAGQNSKFLQYGVIQKNKQHEELLNSNDVFLGMVFIIMMERILFLYDLHMYNFGFTKINDKWQPKIIDFSIFKSTDYWHFKRSKFYFDSYLSGYTFFGQFQQRYNKFWPNIFQKHNDNLKNIYKSVFQQKIRNFCQIVDQTQKQILSLFKSNIIYKGVDEEDYEQIKQRLEIYITGIKFNYNTFYEKLGINKIIEQNSPAIQSQS